MPEQLRRRAGPERTAVAPAFEARAGLGSGEPVPGRAPANRIRRPSHDRRLGRCLVERQRIDRDVAWEGEEPGGDEPGLDAAAVEPGAHDGRVGEVGPVDVVGIDRDAGEEPERRRHGAGGECLVGVVAVEVRSADRAEEVGRDVGVHPVDVVVVDRQARRVAERRDEILVDARATQPRAADRARVEVRPIDVGAVDGQLARAGGAADEVLIHARTVQPGAADRAVCPVRPVDVARAHGDAADRPGPLDEFVVDPRSVDPGPAHRLGRVRPVDVLRVDRDRLGEPERGDEAPVGAGAVQPGAADRRTVTVGPVDVGGGPGGEDQRQAKQ